MIYIKTLIFAYLVLFVGLFFSGMQSGPGNQNWLFALIGLVWPTTAVLIFVTTLFANNKKQEVAVKKKEQPIEVVEVAAKPKPPVVIVTSRPYVADMKAYGTQAQGRCERQTQVKQEVPVPKSPVVAKPPKKNDNDFIDDLANI